MGTWISDFEPMIKNSAVSFAVDGVISERDTRIAYVVPLIDDTIHW